MPPLGDHVFHRSARAAFRSLIVGHADEMEPTPEPQVEVARGHVRRRTMQRVAQGLHRSLLPAVDPGASPQERADARRTATLGDLGAWQQVLRPDACFTHLSSAIVRRWWLPELPDPLPVWIAQGKKHNHTRRRGARVLRLAAAPEVETIDGVRLATAAETLLATAGDLTTLDLVVLIDSALQAGDVTLDELPALAGTRRRAAALLRAALALVDGRSESAWETLLRVLHLSCGIEVEPQREFRHGATFVARGDLWLVGTRTLHEYDGAEHRDRRRQQKDLQRDRRIVAAGLVRRGYVKDDIVNRPEEILRDACAALGRPFDLALLQPWLELWHESSYGPLGRLRLAERLAVPERRGGFRQS